MKETEARRRPISGWMRTLFGLGIGLCVALCLKIFLIWSNESDGNLLIRVVMLGVPLSCALSLSWILHRTLGTSMVETGIEQRTIFGTRFMPWTTILEAKRSGANLILRDRDHRKIVVAVYLHRDGRAIVKRVRDETTGLVAPLRPN